MYPGRESTIEQPDQSMTTLRTPFITYRMVRLTQAGRRHSLASPRKATPICATRRLRHTRAVDLTLPTLADTEALAARVAALARAQDAILLSGPLGAGKTAFARAFLRAASGNPALDVPSPSYTLVQTYDLPLGPAHHFDLWRLDGPAALAELGWDDAARDIVLVEWPDRLGPLRPADALAIDFAHAAGDRRRAILAGWPDRIARLA